MAQMNISVNGRIDKDKDKDKDREKIFRLTLSNLKYKIIFKAA